jgi:hypothetical protein
MSRKVAITSVAVENTGVGTSAGAIEAGQLSWPDRGVAPALLPAKTAGAA